MILYHASPISRFDKIVGDKQLRIDAPLIWDEDISPCILTNENIDTNARTTTGYVYLTNSIAAAIHYGVIACSKVNDMEFVIFRIELNNSILQPDRDDLSLLVDSKYRNIEVSAQESLDLVRSVCVSANINLIDAEYVKCQRPLIQREQCVVDMLSVATIESEDNLTEYQINFIKEATESFAGKYEWVPIRDVF